MYFHLTHKDFVIFNVHYRLCCSVKCEKWERFPRKNYFRKEFKCAQELFVVG